MEKEVIGSATDSQREKLGRKGVVGAGVSLPFCCRGPEEMLVIELHRDHQYLS
jgi:hypothetical protein